REVREELNINAPIAGIAKAGHRGADSVERSSRHQPDDDARRHVYRSLIGGGASFVTRRITPPFCAISFCASSRETPFFCITIASLTLLSARSSSFVASSRDTPHTSITIRWLRSISLLLVARRSTIRLPYVLPSLIMAPVVIVFSTSFVAVPAFMRVEPVTTSGPTIGSIVTSTLATRSAGGGEDATIPVLAPRVAARSSAARTYGVV